jgi:amidase
LGALTGIDPRDPATEASAGKFYADYTQFLDPNGLLGARIGVARKIYTGYNPHVDAIFEKALETLRSMGAILVDPADIPTAEEIKNSQDELTVLTYEFKANLNSYLATRVPDPAHPEGIVARSLEDLIAFNAEHAEQEMPYFGQEIFEMSQARGPLTDEEYLTALANNRRRGGKEGIDAVLDQYELDALVAPTGQPAWPIDLLNGDHFGGGSSSPAAITGYPLLTLPAGFVHGLPVGLSFMGRAFSEPTLIKLAYAFEQATKVRQAPKFIPSFPMS